MTGHSPSPANTCSRQLLGPVCRDRGRDVRLLDGHTLEGTVEAAPSGIHDEVLGQIRAAKGTSESWAQHALKVHDDATP